MLARRALPQEYKDWNIRWGAPSGHPDPDGLTYPQRLADPDPSRFGPFGFQVVSDTRAFEYPWAVHAAELSPGMRVLDVGAGLSGLQFALSMEGCEVVNIDPSAIEEVAWHRGSSARPGFTDWWLTVERHKALNEVFGTDVRLLAQRLQDADVETASFDRIFCLSVLEHVDLAEGREMLARIGELLKPGGLALLTVDLFFDLKPIGVLERNMWGRNIDVHALLQGQKLELVQGEPSELLGFPEFDIDHLVQLVPDLLIGVFSCASQSLVLRRPRD